jgi:hypothetical protein
MENTVKKDYDIDSLFDMFQAVLKAILIAYQENKSKIPDLCNNASANIKRLQDR